jgi:hypothetical protein
MVDEEVENLEEKALHLIQHFLPPCGTPLEIHHWILRSTC